MTSGGRRLVNTFAGRYEGDIDDHEQLEHVLQQALTSARAKHPDLDVPVAAYVRYLAERTTLDDSAHRLVARLCSDDLYLACAASRGDSAAIVKFETACFASLGAAFRRLGIATWQREEVEQRLRLRLLTSDDAGKCGIEGYAGRGPLQQWVKVVALNEARALAGKQAREVAIDEQELTALAVAATDPALASFKERARAAYAAAVQEALSSLTKRERNLLRCQVVDGLSSTQLAAIYHVHRATIARWLADIREKLQELARAAVAAKLAVDRSEVESIERLVRSNLAISVERLLKRS